jgi:hypothetical protein
VRPVRVPDHLLETAVVLDDLRLLYVPVPKAGSTAIMWALAEIVGLKSDDFARSRKLEMTRALAVHDKSIWGTRYRLEGRSAKEIEWILGSDEWLRVTVVREPMRRLWSGWVSKILVRDPRFSEIYGELGLDAITSARDVVESFRRFARALPGRHAWHDPHWSSQADLIGAGDVGYGHVGRVEHLDRTMTVVGEHVASRGGGVPALTRENRSFVPFTPSVFDRASLVACTSWTTRDRELFEYEPLGAAEEEPSDAWLGMVEGTIPAIRAVVERNERISDMRRMLGDMRPVRRGARSHLRGIRRALRGALGRRLRGRTTRGA